jgi:hypothetical protein
VVDFRVKRVFQAPYGSEISILLWLKFHGFDQVDDGIDMGYAHGVFISTTGGSIRIVAYCILSKYIAIEAYYIG